MFRLGSAIWWTDSSTVVALMTGISSKPIETFSIGFEDEVVDEQFLKAL